MNIKFERLLRKHMSDHDIDFDPVEHLSLIDNGERQSYEVNVDGEIKNAWYEIIFHPFCTKEESFICAYGLDENNGNYTYLSHPQESFQSTR